MIEFKIPHIDKNTTYAQVWQELSGMKLKFLSLLISFLLISTYWVRHHVLFKHICDYNRTVLFWNLLMLLPVIFFPFTTAFFYESVENGKVIPLATQFLLLNNIIAGAMMYALYWLVTKKYPSMTYPMEQEEKDIFAYRLLWMTIGFICMYILTFISMQAAAWGILPMFFARLYKRYLKRKKIKSHHAG